MYVRVQLSSRTENLVNWLFTLRYRAVNNSFELCHHDSHRNRQQTASCLPRLSIMSKLGFGRITRQLEPVPVMFVIPSPEVTQQFFLSLAVIHEEQSLKRGIMYHLCFMLITWAWITLPSDVPGISVPIPLPHQHKNTKECNTFCPNVGWTLSLQRRKAQRSESSGKT